MNLTLLQGWRNDRSTAPAIIWTWFESREEMFASLSVKAGFPRYKFFSEFPSLRPFPNVNSIGNEYFETRVFQ